MAALVVRTEWNESGKARKRDKARERHKSGLNSSASLGVHRNSGCSMSTNQTTVSKLVEQRVPPKLSSSVAPAILHDLCMDLKYELRLRDFRRELAEESLYKTVKV